MNRNILFSCKSNETELFVEVHTHTDVEGTEIISFLYCHSVTVKYCLLPPPQAIL